jgi:hypothetical protein
MPDPHLTDRVFAILAFPFTALTGLFFTPIIVFTRNNMR